jgi:hypothetical protein
MKTKFLLVLLAVLVVVLSFSCGALLGLLWHCQKQNCEKDSRISIMEQVIIDDRVSPTIVNLRKGILVVFSSVVASEENDVRLLVVNCEQQSEFDPFQRDKSTVSFFLPKNLLGKQFTLKVSRSGSERKEIEPTGIKDLAL